MFSVAVFGFLKKGAANSKLKPYTENRLLTACALRQPYNKYLTFSF